MKKYHSLLEKSKYFKQGFDYFSGENIKDQLEKYGFFNTDHLIQFNSKDEKIEIKNKNDLQRIIDAEKQSILDNDELKTTWDKISSILHKNEQLRITHNYLRDNVKILQKLADPKEFAKEVWFSYFIDCKDLINSLLKEYESGKEEIKQIVEEAQKEHETWKNVITLYNERFSVPFRINIKNQSDVILNNAEIPIIEFEFRDSTGKIKVEESTLYSVLGTGEKKALHILNIIFEVEARKENKQETLFIIDDIVDSFDYKNKYAIIQYLKEISEVPHFKLIILTHNFDFFRTINHKGIVERPKSYFVYKNAKGIKLEKAIGVNNIFIKDILKNLNNKRKIIASIPFARNIIEYTKGIEDDDYRKLTSLLHFKEDTDKILLSDLKSILGRNFSIPKEDLGNDTDHKIVDLIFNEAEKCSKNNTEGINFENKIVLAIGIRLKAEQYVISKINDNDFVSSITKHQTHKLIDKYKEKFPTESENIKILNAVNLMTPENIHLNSFMYEPILDMSDIDLKNLYCKVSQMTA